MAITCDFVFVAEGREPSGYPAFMSHSPDGSWSPKCRWLSPPAFHLPPLSGLIRQSFPKGGVFNDRVEKHPSNRVVAPIVGILDVFVEPIVRIFSHIRRSPKLLAVRAMPHERPMQRNNEHIPA